jgi:tetrahydromethanopterin S-methyltransferase subunit F
MVDVATLLMSKLALQHGCFSSSISGICFGLLMAVINDVITINIYCYVGL